ncbi:hypothetical protein ACFL2C_01960 [Patescibacteria group bacterium]
MKGSYLSYFVFLVAYFLLISMVQSLRLEVFWDGWFNLDYLPFWIGGVLGIVLPDADHLIYVYALKPNEVTSKRVDSLVRSRSYRQSLKLLSHTHEERKELIFHNARFQLIFWLLVALVVTSGGSLLGLGLVLGFALHLTADYAMILMNKKDPHYWFRKLDLKLTYAQYRWYLLGNLLLFLFIAFYI